EGKIRARHASGDSVTFGSLHRCADAVKVGGRLVGSTGCRASLREFLHHHLTALVELTGEGLALLHPKGDFLKTHRRSLPMMAASWRYKASLRPGAPGSRAFASALNPSFTRLISSTWL